MLFIIKSIKRELKTRLIYDCRCDERHRLEPKYDEFTCLAYTFRFWGGPTMAGPGTPGTGPVPVASPVLISRLQPFVSFNAILVVYYKSKARAKESI